MRNQEQISDTADSAVCAKGPTRKQLTFSLPPLRRTCYTAPDMKKYPGRLARARPRSLQRILLVALPMVLACLWSRIEPARGDVDPLAAALAVGGLVAADDSFDKWVRDRNGSGQGVAEVISGAGSPVALYLGTWYAEHKAGSKEAKEYYHLARKALGSAGVCTTVLKYATGRSRPDQEKLGDYHFGPSADYDSFPSGHAASAFALATVLAQKEPDQKAAYYGAASLLGLSRIYMEKHHASDVLAGALLGHLIASYTLKHKRGPFEWTVNF